MAERYCAGCHVTPYCGERCQRRDWEARHGAVCHNLARSAGINIKMENDPPVSALRRPHSPVNGRAAEFADKENVPTKGHNFIPPAQLYNAHQQSQRNQSQTVKRLSGNQEKHKAQPRPYQGGSQDKNQSREEKDFQTSTPNNNRGARNFPKVPRQALRQPATPQGKATDETDNIPVATKPVAETKPVTATKPVEAAKPVEATRTKPVQATTPVEATKPEMPKSNPLKTMSLANATPRKPLVPSSYILQKLQAGAIFAATVVERATAAASNQTGFVCETINEDVMDVYHQLCDEFSLQCEKEKEGYKPRIGETFSYFSKDDEGWYRARCLAPTRGALLDAGRVVSLEPSLCRKLPSAFASVPEFVAVIKLEGLQIGTSVTATVVSTSTLAVKVIVTDESGVVLGEADAAKWATIIEYPQEPEEPQPDFSESKPVEPKVPEPVKNIPEPVKKVLETVKPGLKTVEPQAVPPKPVIRKPLVPDSYAVGNLEVGDVFLAQVGFFDEAERGFVCVALHTDSTDTYTRICEDFPIKCSEDDQQYTPAVGETFAFLNKEDEGWYRARCLSRTRACLLDMPLVTTFDPSVCRKLPSGYADIQEFVAVIKSDKLEADSNVDCVILSITPTETKVRVSGLDGEYQVKRWTPPVEYPAESEEPQRDFSESKPVEPKVPEPVKNIPEPVKKVLETVKPGLKTVEPQAVPPKPVIRKPLVPDSYAVGNLEVGDLFLAQVGFFDEAERGFVCVALHADSTDTYTRICEDFPLKCSEDDQQYTPAVGETFAFLNKEDEGWYRARCLSGTRACLLDMPLVTTFDPSVSRKLPSGYGDIPEFVAVIKSDKLEADSNVDCVILSITRTETKVRVSGLDGEYQVKRWTPPVEYPAESAPATSVNPTAAAAVNPTSAAAVNPTAAAAVNPTAAAAVNPTAATPVNPTAATSAIPTLLRPCLEHNALYILCSVTSLARACVRPIGSQELFDAALHTTGNYGLTAKPLTVPAQKGQLVVAKFSEDGLCYRAFVKRVNVTKTKYLVEYVEYGNEEILQLESLYPCPPKLSLEAMPPQASLVCLSELDAPLTPAATAYIDRLKDNDEQLILTIPGGDKSKASGCLVNLLVAKNCEPASQKIQDLCLQKLFYKDVVSRLPPLSAKGGPVTLTLPYCDQFLLTNGSFAGYLKGDENASKIFEELSQKLQEYGERSGKTPFRPTEREELCVAQNCRVNDKWERAVVIDIDETGAKDPQVMFIDHGNVEVVPTDNIRKMMPEFIEQYPVITRQFDIKDFPVATVTKPEIVRAMRFMEVTPAGSCEVTVRSVRPVQEDGTYEVHAPELLQSLTE